MGNVDLAGTLDLRVEDRVQPAQLICGSVAADRSAVQLTRDQLEELQRRLEEHERNPDDVVAWDDLEKRIRPQLESLHEVVRAWSDEVERRVAELRSGRVQTIPGEQVLEEIEDLTK